jgi:hypothetical protein
MSSTGCNQEDYGKDAEAAITIRTPGGTGNTVAVQVDAGAAYTAHNLLINGASMSRNTAE